MQHAWKDVRGIGVDVHVHRIANRLGWASATDPEGTRKQLQEWLPPDKWGPINAMLVGFGQTVCRYPFPQCEVCEVNQWCPVGRTRTAAQCNSSSGLIKLPAAAAAAAVVAPQEASVDDHRKPQIEQGVMPRAGAASDPAMHV